MNNSLMPEMTLSVEIGTSDSDNWALATRAARMARVPVKGEIVHCDASGDDIRPVSHVEWNFAGTPTIVLEYERYPHETTGELITGHYNNWLEEKMRLWLSNGWLIEYIHDWQRVWWHGEQIADDNALVPDVTPTDAQVTDAINSR